MAALRGERIAIGVVGLGRLWEARHRPALARLSAKFRVAAVYDQVGRRAETEAAALRCAACEGLAALVERPDVEAVYLLTPQWFGLHAAELACGAGKPIFCALPLAGDLPALERLAETVRSTGVAFMPELARRWYPASVRLRELLGTTLGPPRLVLAQGRLFGFDRYGPPGPSSQTTPAPLAVDPGSYLLDWCRFIFQAEPVAARRFGGRVLPGHAGSEADFESVALEFPDGALAQVGSARYYRAAWGDAHRILPPPGVQVFAERGAAWLEMPDRIAWTDSGGAHEERLPAEPSVGEVLNEEFYRVARGESASAPTIDDALAVARLVAGLRGGSG